MGCTYQEYLREPQSFVEAVFHWDKVFAERAKQANKGNKNNI